MKYKNAMAEALRLTDRGANTGNMAPVNYKPTALSYSVILSVRKNVDEGLTINPAPAEEIIWNPTH